MREDGLSSLKEMVKNYAVITTDVFDTLVLRNSMSERTRILRAEARMSKFLAEQGYAIERDHLVSARFSAQRWAFRALETTGIGGEVTFEDVTTRQLSLLGIPVHFWKDRLGFEIEVEKTALFPNEKLKLVLSEFVAAQGKIVAISDTILPASAVTEIINSVCGPDLIHKVHSSADLAKTKRHGEIFSAVHALEAIDPQTALHIGDDLKADVIVPSKLRLNSLHLPRPSLRNKLRKLNGGLTEITLRRERMARATSAQRPTYSSTEEFGRIVMGPIIAQFCQMIWTYSAQAETTHTPVLLFCARGGVGIREAFERTLKTLNLPLNAKRENFLVSRLIAARAAIMARNSAASEELDREFKGDSFAKVANALGGREFNLPKEWDATFSGDAFFDLLFGETGEEVLHVIKTQNDLFKEHFYDIIQNCDRIILCDTGLYGSTQRLLSAGFPELPIETLHLARSNYKGHSEEHFPKVAGLMTEQNRYNSLEIQSCILRYWHVIEQLFEPDVASVRTFKRNENGAVTANSGDLRFGSFSPEKGNAFLTGALSYLDTIPKGEGHRVFSDAEIAWHRLSLAISQPTVTELECLDLGERSADFGRSNKVEIITDQSEQNFAQKLASIKQNLWREGAISREFKVLKGPLLMGVNLAHFLRGARRAFR